ncbi:MAG: DNA polymerase III subunit gamma/tau [Clostridia bacterium]|nr:DNA polymerase III subunit gamma/tau [Clostridia bacterium]
MSYQALYRAWRPDTFTEIVGQEAITRTLKRQVTTGHIAHAYLFCGTRGTGKTSAAKVLSRAINCLNPQDGDPCGECEICRMLKQETSMDVVEIDAASNNGVDEIRDLREKIKYPPAVTKYKVYIIDEVHMLSTGAFNALLKTLEEPPAHAVFILATTEPQRLPATILSRCQRFDFHRISMDVIVERLMVVLGGIGRSASEEALMEIARAAEGAMRDALSLLDVCLSYTDGEVSAQLARDVLGTAGRGAMFEFADALIDGDAGAALTQIDQVMRRGSDPQVFIRDTVAHLRGILLAGAVGDGLSEIMEITPEDAARYVEQSKRIGGDALNRMMALFMRAEPDTKWASRPRTILELAAVRACHPEKEPDAAFSERLERVEKLIESGASVAARPAPKAGGEKAARPAERTAPKPAPIPAEAPPQAYLDALTRLQEENPSIRAPLDSMRFIRFDGRQVVAEFSKKSLMHMKLLERKKALIEGALSDAFGAPVSLSMNLEGSATEKKVSDVAREVINQAYDVFGRDKTSLED